MARALKPTGLTIHLRKYKANVDRDQLPSEARTNVNVNLVSTAILYIPHG